MSQKYDLMVVGAGPCGISVGAAGRMEGLRTLLLDRGCITDSLLSYPYYMTFFSTADRLEVGGVPFTVAGDKPTRREALVYYRRVVDHFDLRVRQHEEVTGIEGRKGEFRVRTRSRFGESSVHQARAVAVATGSFDAPNRLEVPGEDLDKVVHDYREPYPYFDQDVVVVGGGNSAVEASLELYRSGARVTLVHFEDDLDPGVKPWILPDIRNRLDRGEIQVHWRHRVREIRPRSVRIRHVETGESTELDNHWVLALTGWRPDPRLLDDVGVEVDPETLVPHHDPETMETGVSGLYIAGVVAAGTDANRIFIENGREHGPRIVEHLGGNLRKRE